MKRFILALFFLLISFQMVTAQTETGQITGTVKDPTGAVITNATVTVTSIQKQTTRTVTTNDNGLYTITNLQPDVYSVKIEHAGFAPFSGRVQVAVGSAVGFDAVLRVGGAPGEMVEVVAEGPAQVNLESQTISTVVTTQQITELPTLTRNPYDLVATTGNVASDDLGTSGSTWRGVGVAINGQRAASTDILLDGGENVDMFTASTGQSVPLDAVQEFSVLSSNFTAEYGRASGGVVNVATKSGTNAFHGSGYEFYRGSTLSANTAENKAQEIAKPRFVRNQFGYSLGGPIKKDKAFFFSSTEWTRVRSSFPTQYLVPSSELIAASAPNTQAFMAAYGALDSRAKLTGGSITKGDLGYSATTLTGLPSLAALPDSMHMFDIATVAVPTDAGGGAPQNSYMTVNRVDVNLTDKTQFYARYGLQRGNFFDGWVSDSPFAGYMSGENISNQNVLASVTHIFTPSFVSQTKLVYNRLIDLQPITQSAENAPPTLFFSKASGGTRINGIRAYGPGYVPCCYGQGIPFGGPQNVYSFNQDFSWSKGKHQFRFGGQVMHMRDNRVFGAYEDASMLLGNSVPQGLNNFLAGQLLSIQVAVSPQGKQPCPYNYATASPVVSADCTVDFPLGPPKFNRNNRFNDFALYAQDSYKVTPRLTLSLGLRWEYFGVQHNADPSLDANFYFGSGSNWYEQYRNGSAMLAKDSSVGGLWEPNYKNFAPRVGFAWDVFGNGKTSLRGGYGISYERNFGNVTFNVIQNPPNYFVLTGGPSDFGGSLPITVSNYGPLAGTTGSKALPASSLRHVDQNLKTAYAEMWSLAIDRELAKNTVLSLEYTGSRGLKLYSLEDPNRYGSGVIYLGDDPNVNPLSRMNMQYAPASYNRANRGFSNYNALNTKLRTQNLHNTGLQLMVNYTYAHSIDNLSSTFSDSSMNYNVGMLDPFNPSLDKGNSDFDIRHRLVISGIWESPFFKNANNPFLKHAFGGWSLAPIVTIRSGVPYTLYDSTNGYYYSPRVQLVGPNSTADQGTVLNPNQFNILTINNAAGDGLYVNPLIGLAEIGNCTTPGEGALHACPWPSNMTGRNAFRGPGAWFTTFGVYKKVRVSERVNLQFRTEFYNLFNHPNMYTEAGNLDMWSNNYCSSTGATSQTCSITGKKYDNRDIQLGLKIVF